MNGLVAFVSTKNEAEEIDFIYKVLFIGLRARKLGKEAYDRMKKGDFTKTPIKKKIEKEIEKEIVNGYDINAE